MYRAGCLVLTLVCVFYCIQLASAIIWVHVLYLKLLQEDGDERKAGDSELDTSSKNMLPKGNGSSARTEDDREADQRNGVRRKR